MFKIGNVEIKNKVILAPMAGYTTFAYRTFMAKFGIGLAYTEMVSDVGIIYKNDVTLSYLPKDNDDVRPIALQLFGGEKETLIAAIKQIQESNINYDILDINLGCPMPKVTAKNGGSAWLKKPNELIEMLTEVVNISTRPVTVKIRLGWDENNINFLSLISEFEEIGISAVALHLRTTKQKYKGHVNYELARDLQDKMIIPLIISGDIFTLDDAIKALEITKAKGVMIARGGIGNPHLIKEINEYYETGKRLPKPTIDEQLTYMLDLMDLLIEEMGERNAIRQFRSIAPHFLKGYPNIKQYRNQLTQVIETRDDVINVANEIKKISLSL
ncbi:MAG: tRNA dihydrouridine synthase DusB [Bacilli bacterium]|jgi:tRNA-dihydrouridine synthase B